VAFWSDRHTMSGGQPVRLARARTARPGRNRPVIALGGLGEREPWCVHGGGGVELAEVVDAVEAHDPVTVQPLPVAIEGVSPVVP